MYLLLILLFLFSLSWLCVGRFRVHAMTKGLLDHPSARSSHSIPTPRGGGLIIVLLALVAGAVGVLLGVWPRALAIAFLPGALMIGWIGYWDDRHDVPARWRALVHFIAGLAGVIALGSMEAIDIELAGMHFGWLGSLLAVLSIVWSVNLFNFMDGTDGIAGVEALFVLGGGGLILWQAGGQPLAIPALALAALVGGFLAWNWPPAKIFMGDVGSGFLGFSIAMFALAGEVWYKVPVLLWIILYGVFWFDATVTLARRVLGRECWYVAHRSHAYQRLHHLCGWTHRRILAAVIGLNTGLGAMALWAWVYGQEMLWAFLGAVVLLAVSYVAVERCAPMRIGA